MDYLEEHVRPANGIQAETIKFNSFIANHKPTGWVEKVKEATHSPSLSVEEYELLKASDSIPVVLSLTEYWFFKEAVEKYFGKEYKD